MNAPYLETFIAMMKLLVSWPVIILIIIILFRDKFVILFETLADKFGTSVLKKAEIAGTSLEFYEPKTLETSVGKTNISAVPSHFDTDSFVFRSARFGFEISYPLGGDWVPIFDDNQNEGLKEYLAQQGQITVASIASKEEVEGLRPNINVLVQPAGDIEITEYVAQSVKQLVIQKGTVLSYKVDKKTNGASFTYLMPVAKSETEVIMLNCVSRVTLINGLAYLATTTVLDGVPLPERIRKDLNAMLNSFETTANRG